MLDIAYVAVIHYNVLQVHEYMELANFKLALTFCDRALEQEPDSVHTLEMKGTIQLESGNIEDAVTVSFVTTDFQCRC